MVGVTALAPGVIAQESQTVPYRAITNVRGDLYRVQDGEYYTVFLVTPDGIILADPLNAAASAWLKSELESRFPNRPVRYVVHTSHAFDRAGGASAFNETAEIVAHENFTAERMRAESALPASLASMDRDQNGVLDLAEIAADAGRSTPALRDRNGDGMVRPAELYFDVAFVESTFSSRRSITLGGETVDLVHPGQAYAADMTILHFPAERVVFAAGYAPLSAMPFSFGGSSPRAVLASMRTVAAIDFDMFVSGDGTVGTRSDFAALSRYLADLVAGVNAGFISRLTVSQIQSTLVLAQHQALPQYAQRTTHIAEAYSRLRRMTANVYGIAQVNRLQRGTFCTQLYLGNCTTTGGPSVVGSAGFSVSFGQVAVLAETNMWGRFTGRRWAPDFYENIVEHRDRLSSVLARYDVVRKPSITLGLGGGLSRVSEEQKVTESTSSQIGPLWTRSMIDTQSGWGRTIGIDLVFPVGNRADVVVPMRFTHTTMRPPWIRGPNDPDLVGHWNVYADVGVSLPVLSSVY